MTDPTAHGGLPMNAGKLGAVVLLLLVAVLALVLIVIAALSNRGSGPGGR